MRNLSRDWIDVLSDTRPYKTPECTPRLMPVFKIPFCIACVMICCSPIEFCVWIMGKVLEGGGWRGGGLSSVFIQFWGFMYRT